MTEANPFILAKNISTKVTLATKGLLYQDGASKFPNGSITVSTMGTTDEKVLSGGGGRNSARLDTVLERCADLRGMKPSDLTADDRSLLLIYIRSVSYGSDFTYETQCKACDKKFRRKVDLLKDFPIVYLDEIVKNQAEPFPLELPACGAKIGLKFLRGHDLAAIERFGESRAKTSVELGDPAYIYTLARCLAEVNGQTVDSTKAAVLLEGMVAKDSRAMRAEMNRLSCGFRLEHDVQCIFCQEEYKVGLPQSAEFFHPTT